MIATPPPRAPILQTALGSGLLTLALGVVVLVGWHAHLPALIQLNPAFVPMQYNTALGFLLLGMGLLALHRQGRGVALWCGLATAAGGAVTGAQYLWGIDVGLDQLFMIHDILIKTSHPGRMAPNTALCFTLGGIGVVLAAEGVRHARTWPLVGLLGTVITTLGLVATLGYLVRLETAYGWFQYTRMALHTAAGFTIWGMGLIALAWHHSMSPTGVIPGWVLGAAGLGGTVATAALWGAYELLEHGSEAFTRHPLHAADLLILGLGLGLALAMVAALGMARTAQERLYQLRLGHAQLQRETREHQATALSLAEANARLTASETRLREILDNSPAAVFMKDLRGRYLFVNRHFETLFGVSGATVVGKEAREVFPTPEAQRFPSSDGEVLKRRSPVTTEEVIPLPDGPHTYIAIQFPLLQANGEPYALCGIATDITERKRMEEDLQRLTHRLELAARSGNIGVWDLDLTTNELVWDDRMFALYGRTREEFPGLYQGWREAAHPQDVERVEEEIAAAIAGGRGFDTAFRILWPDGAVRHIRAAAIVQRDPAGLPRRMIGINHDVTAQKRAEEKLRQANTLLEAVIQQAPFGIMLAEGNRETWRITRVNREAERLNGEPAEQQVGLGMAHRALLHPDRLTWRMFHPDGTPWPVARAPLPLAMQGESTHDAEMTLQRGDGTSHVILCNAVPITDPDGQPMAGLVVFADVTQRKRAEEAMALAKERAEAATRAKSHFLAAMSHEIRTPMNVVIGMGDLLLETPLNEEQRSYVRKLQGAGNNLLELISEILDLSKIEAGQLAITPQPVAPRPLLEETVGLLRVMAAGKGVGLAARVADPVPQWVVVDGVRLRQILFNLVGNAIKFTERGEVGVEMALDRENPALLEVVVKDTGIGIDPRFLELIFDPFSQADGGITRRYGGTGLGLALSRLLVELMGGTIGVTSQPGAGSTFRFTLPFQAAPDQLLPVPTTPPTPATPWDQPPRRILLVEDAEDNRMLIRAFLRHSPHHLEMVPHGAAAVERITGGESFHLVLMDIQMPVMDGYTATRLIRNWEEEQGRDPLPIVALTANALEGEAQRSREAGCTLFLTKPIRKERLLELVGTLPPSGRPPRDPSGTP